MNSSLHAKILKRYTNCNMCKGPAGSCAQPMKQRIDGDEGINNYRVVCNSCYSLIQKSNRPIDGSWNSLGISGTMDPSRPPSSFWDERE